MAKRKKHPKLPNGYGSIKYLGKGRRNPYAVYPPVKEFDVDGKAIQGKALAYVDDWYYGFSILTAYKAGTYIPNEYPPRLTESISSGSIDSVVNFIIDDYKRLNSGVLELTDGIKFSEVFEGYRNYKFRPNSGRVLSKASQNATNGAYNNVAPLHNMPFKDIRHSHMQNILDNCGKGYSSKNNMVILLHGMYKWAINEGLVDKDYSVNISAGSNKDVEHGTPFTQEELKSLWERQGTDDFIDYCLIACYSGYRLAAYSTIEVNLKGGYFKGGVKTAQSINRIVPIHSAIRPLVERNMKKYGKVTPLTRTQIIRRFTEKSDVYFGAVHSSHDCRHTFSTLCEKYGVRENDRKRMLGHSFGDDITNGIYGHREIEDLRTQIEKIQKP